jgi:hypothetical protein
LGSFRRGRTTGIKATVGSLKESNIRAVCNRRPPICVDDPCGIERDQCFSTLCYLRGAPRRSPLDLSFSFASEQVIEMLARAAGIDSLAFRRNNIGDPR